MTARACLAAAALAAAVSAAGCALDASPETKGADAPPTVVPTATPVPDRTAFIAAVDAIAEDAIARGPIAGLSIAVFEHGRPLVAKGYGFADLEGGVAATAETSYPIASVSKQFTAALVLRLADQGRLTLDDPLSRFFPAARARIGSLTLRHLLTHTSGLTHGGPAPRGAAQSVLKRGGAARDQGEAWDYTNYNFSLVGLAIEEVTGRDYPSLVQEEIAGPLGLAGTGYCEDGTPVPGRARDYLSSPRRVSRTDYWQKAKFFAAGGLCSTVLDLVRWEQALENGRVVSPAMLAEMRTPARLPESLEADYGLGTRMGLTGSRRKVGHTGGGQGNKAVVARYPDDDVTIAVLTNTERASAPISANEIEERIARLFFGLPELPSPDPVALELLERYTGEYRDGARLVRVGSEGGVLTIRPGYRHRPESRLLSDGDGRFVAEEDPTIELRFQMRNAESLGYARYRNGWFSGLAVRTREPIPARGPGPAPVTAVR
jgi:CubicO group peptidase (beta-lactamase class C family)